jgi:hypothetical protein
VIPEEKVTSLQGELRAIEASAADVFKATPAEWVAQRLTRVGGVLEADTVHSAPVSCAELSGRSA